MKRRCSTRPRRRTWLLLIAAGVLAGLVVLLLAAPRAGADVYSNIGPAPQVTGGIFERYPISHYQLDQYFPAISVGVFSGIDASGVAPMIAFFIAEVIWLITAFLAQAVITVFTFCFSLNLLTGNGQPGSGALAPVSQAISNIYSHTFGTPWLIAAIVLVGCWAMWKALVMRRYTETAATLAISLLYCLLGLGIVIAPQATIAPASKLTNEMSTALLSLTSQGAVTSEAQAKQTTSDQLFTSLVLEPWTVLEFGGLEHCVSESSGKVRSVAVRPLSSNPNEEARLSQQLESGTEIHADGKTCINNENKYDPHFLAYEFQSEGRNKEHEALEKGDTADLPESDPAKTNKSYPLGPADEPAAQAMGKGGQYERLLLAIVILGGEIGMFLLLGTLAVAVIIAALMLLMYLMLAPVALILGVIPGRGHEFFRRWLTQLAGYLVRKAVYSLILALVLAVCHALASATSDLGWLLAFLLQAAFMWTILFHRNRLTNDLVAATAGSGADRDGASRLQTLYYTTRLARMGGLLRTGSRATSSGDREDQDDAAPSPPTDPPSEGEQNPPSDGGQDPPPRDQPSDAPSPNDETPLEPGDPSGQDPASSGQPEHPDAAAEPDSTGANEEGAEAEPLTPGDSDPANNPAAEPTQPPAVAQERVEPRDGSLSSSPVAEVEATHTTAGADRQEHDATAESPTTPAVDHAPLAEPASNSVPAERESPSPRVAGRPASEEPPSEPAGLDGQSFDELAEPASAHSAETLNAPAIDSDPETDEPSDAQPPSADSPEREAGA